MAGPDLHPAPREAARQPAAQISQRRKRLEAASRPAASIYVDRMYITKALIDQIGPTEGCMRCAGDLIGGRHSDACRARVKLLMAVDPELAVRRSHDPWWHNSGALWRQNVEEEYVAKNADAGELIRHNLGAEFSEEQGAPSPPDATVAAGSSAVLVQGEEGTAEDEVRGMAHRLVNFKLEPAG